MRRTFAQRLIGAQDAERRRVTRELHDEIGQTLTAIKVNLQNIQAAADASPLAAQLDESIVVIDRAVRRLRELALDLRPSLLDDLGLVAALRWFVEREAQRAGLGVEARTDPHAALTAREREVLPLAAQGLSLRQIASALSISPRTAETHRANVMRKLGLHNQTDLVRHAMREGILPPQ